MAKIRVTASIYLDESELEERFVLASGPGGQNVNKVATAVELRFDAARAPALSEPVRARLMRLAGQKLTQDGIIIIQASRFRSQERNRADARERLFALIHTATIAPRPRIATKPTRGAKERRLEGKKQRSRIKQGRSGKVEF